MPIDRKDKQGKEEKFTLKMLHVRTFVASHHDPARMVCFHKCSQAVEGSPGKRGRAHQNANCVNEIRLVAHFDVCCHLCGWRTHVVAFVLEPCPRILSLCIHKLFAMPITELNDVSSMLGPLSV